MEFGVASAAGRSIGRWKPLARCRLCTVVHVTITFVKRTCSGLHSLRARAMRLRSAQQLLMTTVIMLTRSFTPVFALATTLAACNANEDLDFGEISSEVSVATFTTSTCSTSAVLGLSKQIAEEIGCMNPDSMVAFAPGGGITFSSNAVLPYLSAAGKADLQRVAATRSIQINSGFRTVAQQYLLYRWRQTGRCGISAAATPGRSNHESGRALDLANWSSAMSTMRANRWSHPLPNDEVHFEHLSSPDIRGRDVLAFQRLWNRNNPNDRIAEDGAYGPATEARLRQSPAEGFLRGSTCGNGLATGPRVVAIDGPDKVAPLTRAHYRISLVNDGSVDWSEATKLVVADGPSELHDPQTWSTETEIGEIGIVVPAGGGRGVIELDIAAPDVTEPVAFNMKLALVENGQEHGTIDVALTVTPYGDDGTSGEAEDDHDGEGHDEIEGGCNAGGNAGWMAMLLPLLAVLRRRRRA